LELDSDVAVFRNQVPRRHPIFQSERLQQPLWHLMMDAKVVGESGLGRGVVRLIQDQTPALIVVDFFLPDTDGISLMRDLRRNGSKTKTLLLARRLPHAFVKDAFQAGFLGCVLKDEPLETIIAGVRSVLKGDSFLGPLLQSEMAVAVGQRDREDHSLAELSGRQREILTLLARGLSSKAIGKALFLSAKTVDAHRLSINRKLGVRSLADLARYCAVHRLEGD
jgi:DNA-binding NarL/FixJ family response regulator